MTDYLDDAMRVESEERAMELLKGYINRLFKERKEMADYLRDAMEVKNEEEAKKILEDYTNWIFKSRKVDKELDPVSMEEAARIARGNIGYFLGYGAKRSVMEIWEGIGANHPVFGQLSKMVDEDGGVKDEATAGKVFKAGERMGKQAAKRAARVGK